MESEKEVFGKYIKDKGLKLTPERRIILDEVFSTHEHFDVEMLFERLNAKGERISRATIYRTLPLLLDSKLICEAIRCKDRVYYEHIYGHKHHSHLVCIKCGKVIEFEDDKIEEEKNRICKKYNFKPIEYRFGVRGYCKDCQ
jgi:Fur family transcriptional regulator, ferric uptake regulator